MNIINLLKQRVSSFVIILIGLVTIISGYNGISLATPTLQLDIGGGTYDMSTETIVASENPFKLYAYLIPNSSNKLSDYYYISMALTPKLDTPGSLGTVLFNSTTIDVTSDMEYGTPPLETYLGDIASTDPGDLPGHGIFETYFYEHEFQFSSSQQISKYNTQDRAISGGSIPTSGTGMYYVVFDIDTTDLDINYNIHFDLYNTSFAKKSTTDLDVTKFAPFSHDAESRKVPEPSTLLLLGSGLMALGLIKRRKK